MAGSVRRNIAVDITVSLVGKTRGPRGIRFQVLNGKIGPCLTWSRDHLQAPPGTRTHDTVTGYG